MRQDVAHVLVLITDGRAQDNVVPPSRIARALGQLTCCTSSINVMLIIFTVAKNCKPGWNHRKCHVLTYCVSLGVSVLAVGVSNADMEELNKIAAPTSYKNIFYSPTFDDFPSIEREFINMMCSEELLSEFKLNDEARHEKTKILLLSLFPFFHCTLSFIHACNEAKLYNWPRCV